MKKVLIIITTGMEASGGLATVMLNYYRAMDKKNLKIDFASVNELDISLNEEIKKHGSVYYNLGNRKKHLLRYMRRLYYIARKNNYDIVHVNGNSATMIIELFTVKRAGINKRIAHCHTTNSNYPVINKILIPFFKKYYTDAIAVSDAAGEWLYKDDYVVLNNAIDVNHYAFNSEIRENIRKKHNLQETDFVVGNVGKLNKAKNQRFLLEIFKELKKIKNNVKLMIVGGGELESELKNQAENLGINNDVIFTGMVDDTSSYLQAMDVFVFTSVFEGFGMSLIEAQASGLSCICSDAVPKATCVSEYINYMSLDLQADKWAERIARENISTDRFYKSQNACKSIGKSGFDISLEADKLREIYEKNQ